MMDLNDKVVNDLLQEWKERLGLENWIITLKYNCKFEDLELENCCGETNWEDTIKTATIKIVSSEEYGKDRLIDYDFEQILVHELLHIKFGLLSFTQQDYDGKVVAELRHQLIDDLARALVMARRGQTKRQLNPNCAEVKDRNEPKKEIEITPLGSTTKLVVEE